MSGWLTPKLEYNRKLQALPCARLTGLEAGETELRASNHHPDPRTSRYGQRLEEEILGCRMSGWLTPKLECNRTL